MKIPLTCPKLQLGKFLELRLASGAQLNMPSTYSSMNSWRDLPNRFIMLFNTFAGFPCLLTGYVVL
jgi:hypothetical protein